MRPLLSDLLPLVEGLPHPIQDKLTSVCVDSRLVAPDSLFFALPGARSDGHLYLQEALNKGAKAACIRKDFAGPVPKGLTVLRVDDTLKCLQAMAKARIHSTKAKVLAVTGSVGKTTTKEFISTILEHKRKVARTSGNHNSQIGLAVSLLNTIEGDEE
jgi:UDP-N-acetylmuramoyl-tripeptide--D-alanyl-D-alanine ligase